MANLVITDPAVCAAAREEAARILADWVPGTRIWAPLADPAVCAAICEAASERLSAPVVLERAYRRSPGSRHGEYAGHDVLIVED